MIVPLSYNFRSLLVRRESTLMTALGIGLTVAVLVSTLALIEGLRVSFAAASHPLHIVVMRKGSTSELVSSLSRAAYGELRQRPGIARAAGGEPMVSLEMLSVVTLKNEQNQEGMQITLRGLLPTGMEMRPYLRVVEGRMFQTGRRELLVGKGIATRYPNARLGGTLKFGRGDWEVVGVMDAGRSAINSEIFADLNQLSADYNRSQVLSSALVRAIDAGSVSALISDIENNRQLNAMAVTEQSYYDQQTISSLPVRFMGFFIAAVMAIGSAFAAMNTMYAAIARRSAEIGVLRVLGFSRAAVLLSFFIESLLLALLGGLLGCLLALPMNGFQTGIGNWVTFSEMVFEFRITPVVCLQGIAFALVMGALGGLLPAASAARKQILAALRGQ
jgi:ABC-type lipoprotein release transport system permease subunit